MISIGEAAAAVVDHLQRVLELRERLAGLPPLPPCDIPPARWRTLQEDSRQFLADNPGWALLALDLGWDPLQLLGANRVKPFARVDQMGLLWLVNRARVDELDETSCVLITPTGARTTYRARPLLLDEVALPWELSNARTAGDH
jgi:hypothetical protein